MKNRTVDQFPLAVSAARDSWRILLISALLLGVLVAGTLYAQKGTGEVAGTVLLDSSKTGVADATVTVTEMSSKVERSTKSTPNGTYRLSKLDVGKYEMKTQAAGFQTFRQHLYVSYDAAVRVDIRLDRASAEPRKKK